MNGNNPQWVPFDGDPFAEEPQSKDQGQWVPFNGDPFAEPEPTQTKPAETQGSDFILDHVLPGIHATQPQEETGMGWGEAIGGSMVEGSKDVVRSHANTWLGLMRGNVSGYQQALMEEGYTPEDIQAHLDHDIPLPELDDEGVDPVRSVRQFLQRQGVGKSIHDAAQRQETATLENSQLSNPMFDSDEGFQRRLQAEGGMKQFAGDVSRAVPQVAGSVAANVVGGPVLSGINILSNITGMDYEKHLRDGVPEDKAFNAAFYDAILQAPLEQIGVGKVADVFQVKNRLLGKLKKLVAASATEGITEYFQAYPEKLTELFAKDPDVNSLAEVEGFVDEITTSKFQKGAGYQGLVGAFAGGATAVPGVLVNHGDADTQGDEGPDIDLPLVEEPPQPAQGEEFEGARDTFLNRAGDPLEQPLDLTDIAKHGHPDAKEYALDEALEAQRQQDARERAFGTGEARLVDYEPPGGNEEAGAILKQHLNPDEQRQLPVGTNEELLALAPGSSDSPIMLPEAETEDFSAMPKAVLNRVATSLGINKPGKIPKSKLVPMVLQLQEQHAPVVEQPSPAPAVDALNEQTNPVVDQIPSKMEDKPIEAEESSKKSGLIEFSADDIPRQLAYDAHRGTSFVPDKRAEQEQQDYVTTMKAVHDDLFNRVPVEKHGELAKELERFKKGELKKRQALLHARSRIVSTMIAGGSNFPVARMEKRNATERKRLNEYLDWHKRAVKAIERKMGIGPQANVIESTDKDAVGKLREKLAKLEEAQERMKKANKEYRRTKGDIDAMDISDGDKERIREWEESSTPLKGSLPFPSYALKNNNANIRRVKQRIESVSKEQARPDAEIPFDGGRIEDSGETGKVRVFFDEKPGTDVRNALKKRGFRWARSVGAWQRKRTPQALEVAKDVLGAASSPVVESSARRNDNGTVQEREGTRRLSEEDGREQRQTHSGRSVQSVAQDQGRTGRSHAAGRKPTRTAKGQAVSVLHSEGEDAARYELREASELVPSHDPSRNFTKNEPYPADVQERPYHSDQGEQSKVRRNATNLDPRFVVSDNPDAINGAPITTENGVVLGGNSRTMSIQLAYAENPEKAEGYRKALTEKAESFGLHPDDVGRFEQPVLVRVVREQMDSPTMARKARIYNQSFTQGLDSKAEGVSRGRMVSDNTIGVLANAMEEHPTLRDYLNQARSRQLVQSLEADGVLEASQLARLTNKNTGLLNEEGKRLVEQALRGRVIDDFDLLDAAPAGILQKIDRILPAAAKFQARGEEWDITSKLKDALRQIVRMKAQGLSDLGQYFGTQSLVETDPAKGDPNVVALAHDLAEMKPLELKAAFDAYARDAVQSQKGQMKLPGTKLPTVEESFEREFKGKKVRFSNRGRSTEGIDAEKVSDVVDRLQAMAVNAPEVKVVQSMNQLPAHIRKESDARGGIPESAYDEQTGIVWFVADNIESESRALSLWLHEAGLHNGLRGLFSSAKHLNNILDMVWRSAPRAEMKAIMKEYKYKDTLDGRMKAAEEYLARVAEKVQMNDVLTKKESTIWQRLVKAFKRFTAWLKGKPLAEDDIAQIVLDSVRWTTTGKPSNATRDIYQRATGEAMARPLSGSGVRFSQKQASPESIDYGKRVNEAAEKWATVVDDMFAGKVNPRALLQMGATPDLLVGLGAPALPLTMRQVTFKKIAGIKADKRSGHIHNLSARQLKNLYAGLADPVAVMQPHPGKMEVVVEMIEDGNPVLVALDLKVHEGNVEVNSVATAFGNDRIGRVLVGAAKAGNLSYMDRKKLDALEDRSDNLKRGVPLSVRVLQARRGKKIKFPSDVVKPAGRVWFSMKQGDSSLSAGDAAADILQKHMDPQGAQQSQKAKEAEAEAKKLVKTSVPTKKEDPGFWRKVRELRRKRLLGREDMGLLEKIVRQPYWIAKDHPEFKNFMDIEIKREEARTEMLLKSWEKVDDKLKALGKEGKKTLEKVIWHIEGKKLKEVTASKFVKDGLDDNGHQKYRLNNKHYEELRAVLAKHGIDEAVIDAVVAIRQSLDADMLLVYNRLRRMREDGADDTYINDYRTRMGQVHNYFPHVRVGSYYIRALDPKTGETLYRQHFDATGPNIDIKGAKLERELSKKFPDVEWDHGENEGLPEDIYDYTIPVDAMEQIISTAVDRTGKDVEKRLEMKDLLHQATAEVLKTRGWSKHTIRRQGTPGFETENITQILHGYKSGLYGWLTKMDAAKAFTSELYKLDAKKHPRLYGYSVRYVQDMLRNSDKIDSLVQQVKGLAFLKFLGGNIKTATLNLTQNLVAGVPRLAADTDARTASRYFKDALEYVANGVKNIDTLDGDAKRLLEELYYSGVTADQYMREVQGEMKGATGRVLHKANRAMGMPMSVAERFNRCSLALAAYRAARDGKVRDSKVLDETGYKPGDKWNYDDAKAFAEGIVLDSHFLYGKANRPELFRGATGNKLLSAAYTFRTFSHGLLSLWRHLLTHKGWKGAASVASSLAFTAGLGGVTALPLYKLFTSIVRQLWGEDPTEEVRNLTDNHTLRDIMTYGVLSPAGFSISGSLGMELPGAFDRVEVDKPVGKQVLDNAVEIIGIPYALLEMGAQGTEQLAKGEFWKAMKTLAPNVIANPMKAYELYTEGSYTKSGRPINIPGERGPMKLTGSEAIGQALGFYPVRKAKGWDMHQTLESLKNYKDKRQGELVKAYLKAKRAGDSEALREVLAQWRAWNARMREEGRPEFMIMALPRLARRRERVRQPPKRMRPRARRLRENYGM